MTHARAIWERDPFDPDAKAWRETRSTIDWETRLVSQSTQAVADWHRAHPVQSLVLRTGLLKSPGSLKGLIQKQASDERFLAGSQGRLQELEQTWARKRVVYQQQLERQGTEIREARRHLQVVEQNRRTSSKYGSAKIRVSARNGSAAGSAIAAGEDGAADTFCPLTGHQQLPVPSWGANYADPEGSNERNTACK